MLELHSLQRVIKLNTDRVSTQTLLSTSVTTSGAVSSRAQICTSAGAFMKQASLSCLFYTLSPICCNFSAEKLFESVSCIKYTFDCYLPHRKWLNDPLLLRKDQIHSLCGQYHWKHTAVVHHSLLMSIHCCLQISLGVKQVSLRWKNIM